MNMLSGKTPVSQDKSKKIERERLSKTKQKNVRYIGYIAILYTYKYLFRKDRNRDLPERGSKIIIVLFFKN